MAAPAKAKVLATTSSNSALEPFHRLWRKTPYAGDYLGLLVLLIIYLIFQLTHPEPFHRLFRLNDPRIQFPHADIERVPVYFLFLYTFALPYTVLILSLLLQRATFHKGHTVLLNLFTTLLLTTLLTDIFKNAIGRPRPDLLARCQPELSTPTDQLVDWHVCTTTNHHLLHDGWRSFPSGHSSVSFAGLGYVSLYLASQTGTLRARGNLVSVVLCLAPLVGAAMIAVSRLEDYRHDFADVIAGSSLGFLVALGNWRRWWPSLFEAGCEEPYAVSGVEGRRGSERGEFRRVRDEEEDGGWSGREEEDEGLGGSSRRL